MHSPSSLCIAEVVEAVARVLRVAVLAVLVMNCLQAVVVMIPGRMFAAEVWCEIFSPFYKKILTIALGDCDGSPVDDIESR